MTTPSEPITSVCCGVASVCMSMAARVSRAATHAVGNAATTPITVGTVADCACVTWAAIAPPKPKAPIKPAMLGRDSAVSDPECPPWPPPCPKPVKVERQVQVEMQVSEVEVTAEHDRRGQEE